MDEIVAIFSDFLYYYRQTILFFSSTPPIFLEDTPTLRRKEGYYERYNEGFPSVYRYRENTAPTGDMTE